MSGPGGERGGFPATRLSQVLALRSPDPRERTRAFEVLARAYHVPVYKYARVFKRWPPERASELTQDFFAEALEKDTFARYEPERARFRTYLRMCFDRFAANQARADAAIKRGGKSSVVSLDVTGLERELARTPDAADASPEAFFEREWIRHLMGTAIDALREHCTARGKLVHFTVFERIDLADDERRPSYAEVASELGISVTDVTNRLHYARRELRRVVLATLRSITASEEEFREEALAVLGMHV